MTTSFGAATYRGVKGYVQFSGRASRSEFWWWIVFYVLIVLSGRIIDEIMSYTTSINIFARHPIETLCFLVLFLPYLAVTTRRLHDINKSGWWQVLWVSMFITASISLSVNIVALQSLPQTISLEETSRLNIAGITFATVQIILVLIFMLMLLIKQGDARENHYGKRN